MKRILALVLALMLVLTGCAGTGSITGVKGKYTPYSEMVYTRPEPEVMELLLERCCETARTDTSLERVMAAVYQYYDAYDAFYTNYDLAYIGYNRDVTDEYWDGEFTFCAECANGVEAGLEELYRALAQSPIREELERVYFGVGFFEAYDGEGIWDPYFLDLMDRESMLISEYYALCEEANSVEYYSQAYFDGYADAMCQKLIDLVLLRRELAAYVGYEGYDQFAYDFYHYRDYTPEQAMEYLLSIRDEMASLYSRVNETDAWDAGYAWAGEQDMINYLSAVAKNMGGTVLEAYRLMEAAGLYDIAYSEKKFASSFELYLTVYGEPYVFVSPSGYLMDCLSFTHEFGHFVTDYSVPGGSWAGTDVLEVFSQGMEYLSLAYAGEYHALVRYKLADCLATYVEQAAYACFEQRLYALTEEELTVEHVYALYEQTVTEFGLDYEGMGWDYRDVVMVPHFYTDPMYIISYVVSNDLAFQLYQQELEQPGRGLETFVENLDTECVYLLEFAGDAGLESPFTPGRISSVASELEELLNKPMG